MAAVAILTIDPFKSIANSLGSLVDIHASNINSVAMTHFGKVFQNGNSQVVKQFAKLKNKYSNLVLLVRCKCKREHYHFLEKYCLTNAQNQSNFVFEYN